MRVVYKNNYIGIAIIIFMILCTLWGNLPKSQHTVKVVNKTWELRIDVEREIASYTDCQSRSRKCRCDGGRIHRKCFEVFDSMVNKGNYQTPPTWPDKGQGKYSGIGGHIYFVYLEDYYIHFADLSTHQEFKLLTYRRKEFKLLTYRRKKYDSYKIGSQWKIEANNLGKITKISKIP